MSKLATLLLVTVLAVSILVVVGSVFAQSPPAPTAPEFTVKFVNASYAVTTTNSYTGVDETEQVSNNSIEITITNQPFSHQDYQIYYNVRVKPRFEENWTEVYPVRNTTSSLNDVGDYSYFSYAEYINDDSPSKSKSGYTIIVFPVVPTNLYLASGYDIQRHYSGSDGQEDSISGFLSAIPDNGQLDFQVKALVGHDSQRWVIEHPFYPSIGGHFTPAVAYDTSSGWSSTQTVTIGEIPTPTPTTTSTPQQTPTTSPDQTSTHSSEPTQPEFTAIIGATILAVVIGAGLGLLIYLIKRK
jgi:hypothetical protein